jgi:hypothetical protein
MAAPPIYMEIYDDPDVIRANDYRCKHGHELFEGVKTVMDYMETDHVNGRKLDPNNFHCTERRIKVYSCRECKGCAYCGVGTVFECSLYAQYEGFNYPFCKPCLTRMLFQFGNMIHSAGYQAQLGICTRCHGHDMIKDSLCGNCTSFSQYEEWKTANPAPNDGNVWEAFGQYDGTHKWTCIRYAFTCCKCNVIHNSRNSDETVCDTCAINSPFIKSGARQQVSGERLYKNHNGIRHVWSKAPNNILNGYHCQCGICVPW